MQSCSQYYHSLHLTQDCNENEYCQIPPECAEHNAVYNILHYLTDIEFLPENVRFYSCNNISNMLNGFALFVQGSSHTFLKESVVFLPIACSTKTNDFFHELELNSLNFEHIDVVAMELGISYYCNIAIVVCNDVNLFYLKV